MSINKEYYLSCNRCGKIYSFKCDDAQGVEDEAIDEGWRIHGDDEKEIMSLEHICPDCIEKEISGKT